MSFVTSILKSVGSHREVKLFLLFMLLPVLSPLLSKSMEGMTMNYSHSFVEFLELALTSQYRLVLPTIILSLIVTSVFKVEIDTGILFLYKDINRSRIFNAKLLSLFTLYGLYLLGTTIFSLLAYYAVMVPNGSVANQFFPLQQGNGSRIGLSVLSVIMLNLMTIVLVGAVSFTAKTIQSVLTGVGLCLLAMTAPFLIGVQYLFPNGYVELAQEKAWLAWGISLFLSLFYLGLAYACGLQRFKNIEF